MRVKSILVVAAVAVVSIGGTAAVFTHVLNTKTNSYDAQVAKLEASLEAIGPLVDCYTVGSKTSTNMPILQTDLVPVKIPQSVVGEGYILDPASIVGKYYKIAIDPMTPITRDVIMDAEMDASSRDVDVTLTRWPVGLKVGDFIDVKLQYPKGESYTVISHKRIEGITEDTLKLFLSEKEQILYGGAFVDYAVNSKNGAAIYATKYIEPGVQQAAIVYYNVPDNILAIIQSNPNILDKVMTDGISRTIIDAGATVSAEMGGAISGAQGEATAKITAARKAYDELQVMLAEQQAVEESEGEEKQGSSFNPAIGREVDIPTDTVIDGGGVE